MEREKKGFWFWFKMSCIAFYQIVEWIVLKLILPILAFILSFLGIAIMDKKRRH